MKLRFKFLAVLMPLAVVLSARADDTFRTLEANGITYKNVTVTTVTATDIYFTYDGGMGNVKLQNLSPALQEHFHYNATTAAAHEQQQALANAQDLASQPPQWGTDLPAALDQARSENKCVLMDFTGSDWCPWCMKLDQEVFSSPQFAAFARNKLVLVRVDFPHNMPQSDELRRANANLASRFKVDSYPTCILLNSSGKELRRENGYVPGGPVEFTARFDSFIPVSVGQAATRRATTGPTTTGPAAAGSSNAGLVSQVAQLVADLAPKLGPHWYWIPGLVLLLLMVRGIRKAST